MPAARPQHPMAVVTRRTGLSPELIRAWERRHHAVAPTRTDGNRRLYTDRDVARLVLLRQVVEAGWPIGQVAHVRDERLRTMLENSQPGLPDGELRGERSARKPAELMARCLDDVVRLDAAGLQAHLDEAAVELGRIDMVDRVLVPLFHRIGGDSAAGQLRIAHEHLASAVAARFLESLQGAYPPASDAPGLVVATPALQHHHLGALLAAATGRMEGWRTTYLGPNLPAEEIVVAARQLRARAVAVSITHTAQAPRLDAELERLGRLLQGVAQLLVGGAAAHGHQVVLDAVGARRLDDLGGLRAYLRAAG